MNLFQKYGIKEVADVVFYSITTVGDEEFYTPVLFLDTLKVSTLEKTAEKVEAKGGKGNKKLITWNFGKEITLNLEDALFSPASMSMIWGGKLNSKLSDYTSAIVKTNLANKYGDSNYSIKAYPSPALTDNEWEIIFAQAEKIGLDSGSGNDNPKIYLYSEEENEDFIAENRQNLVDKYFNRTWEKVGFDFSDEEEFLEMFKYRNPPLPYEISGNEIKKTYLPTTLSIDSLGTIDELINNSTLDSNGVYTYSSAKNKIAPVELTYQYKGGDLSPDWSLDESITWDGLDIQTKTVSGRLTLKFIVQEENSIKKIYPDMLSGMSPVIIGNSMSDPGFAYIFGSEAKSTEPVAFFKQLFGEDSVLPSNPYETLIPTTAKAMPSTIIQNIMMEIDTLDEVGCIDTDYHDIEVIDRMEKCIVKTRNGQKIKVSDQKKNLFRYYADDRTSSYTIFYDAKTMLPLLPMEDGKILEGEDEFTIKMGTVYHKWTRTVKYKESEDDAILGKTLVIDAETFPDAYKIVGETYIRNQKTGKDQRYQFIIHRANVSTDTSVTLEAEGDPTTFSMQVDVLTPPNDIMMELKQYDVEDDPIEGGTRIVPQKSKYTYTPTNIKYVEEVADKNEEIY